MRKKNILIIHPGFPAQFGFLTHKWMQREDLDVRVLIPGGAIIKNDPMENRLENQGWDFSAILHEYPWDPSTFELTTDKTFWNILPAMQHARGVRDKLLEFKEKGWSPEAVICHPSWGGHLFVKQIHPSAKLINYCEYIELPWGPRAYSHEMTEWPHTHEDDSRIVLDHMARLQALELADVNVAPTKWQKELYPREYWNKIKVIHEGVAIPDEVEPFVIKNLPPLKVITFSARSLEPSRGYHTFLRALNRVMKEDAEVNVLLIGDDSRGAYDGRPNKGMDSWTTHLLPELPHVDLDRCHFMGKVPHWAFLKLLQSSTIHVHFNMQSVLSWSCLEAMGQQKYVLASNSGPVREVLYDGYNGNLWTPFNHDDLATKILWALQPENLEATIRMGIQAGFDVAERYSQEGGFLKWDALLNEQLNIKENPHEGSTHHCNRRKEDVHS